jgi:tetratricopeptide (TPR) repeat protein
VDAFKAASLVRCSPDMSRINTWLEDAAIALMPGAGYYKWKITTISDSAQLYFNQGINMYYGFHIIEALASFKKAASFDPENPMVWWAQALAYGPNINDVGYAASPEALDASQKAAALSSKARAEEKLLIEAMVARYSADSTQSREVLNQAYVDKLKLAYDKMPASADIAALYADALMLQHPWDLWNTNGTPKPWQPQIQTVLEKLLKQSPEHPGANHYYIHVMEASPTPAKATASADRLGRLTPGLSHMVHMPSHIYIRTGELSKGASVNETAVKAYKSYANQFPAVVNNAFLYEMHNLHLQANCALLAGREKYSSAVAKQLQSALDTSYLSAPDAMGNFMQYIYMTPTLVHIRFANWADLLKAPKPETRHVYASILYHFGRGMAFTAQNEIGAAAKEEEQMAMYMKNADLKVPLSPFSSAFEGATSAHELLLGQIASKRGNTQQAIQHFSKAVETEERMVYNEPRDWLLSPKQYLGMAYYKAGDWKKAQQAFEGDLKTNNNNVWSLYGLQLALNKQGKKTDAAKVQKRLTLAKKDADIDLEQIATGV